MSNAKALGTDAYVYQACANPHVTVHRMRTRTKNTERAKKVQNGKRFHIGLNTPMTIDRGVHRIPQLMPAQVTLKFQILFAYITN